MVWPPLLEPPPVAKSMGNSVTVVLSLINPLGSPPASSDDTLPKLLPAPESAIQSTQNDVEETLAGIWVCATLDCNTGTTHAKTRAIYRSGAVHMRTTAVMNDSDEALADGSDAKATAAAVFTFGAAVAFVWALPFGAGSPSITS